MAATPQSKADVDPNFEKRIRDIKTQAAKEATARDTGAQTPWFRPEGWNGDLFDVEGLSEPYSREAANQAYLEAVKDPANPGTTGDVVATLTMIDELAAMERAMRLRHMRRPRAVTHMLARKAGHGDDRGPITQCYLEYVRSILKQAKAP